MNKNEVIEGRTLQEWLENKAMFCFGAMPDKVKEWAYNNFEKMQVLISFSKHYNPDEEAYFTLPNFTDVLTADDGLVPIYVYRLSPDYKWPEEPQGEFVEFEIKGGKFKSDTGIIYSWYDVLSCEMNSGDRLTFAGWKFEHNEKESGWTQTRLGIDDEETILSYSNTWKRPLTPTRIRFWRQK